MTLAGAVMAGGRGRRMGREKALLPHPEKGGRALWRCQLETLRAVGCEEYFISLREGQRLPGLPADVRAVPDAAPDAGALGGLVGLLSSMSSERLLILAVDAVDADVALLVPLVEACTGRRCGAIYRREGRYEPLVAIYPRDLLPPARARLEAGRFRLQELVAEAVESGRLEVLPLERDRAASLANLNTGADWADRFGTAPLR